MKKFRRKIRILRNKLCRCFLVTTVLFYVLWPQTGMCACPNCDCSNRVRSVQEEVEPETPKSTCRKCCCDQVEPSDLQAAAQPTLTSGPPRATCCSASGGLANETSGSCRCSCSETKIAPPPPQRTTVQTLEIWQKLEELSPPTFALLPETSFLPDTGFLIQHRMNPLARLPVRLHLLLVVLRN